MQIRCRQVPEVRIDEPGIGIEQQAPAQARRVEHSNPCIKPGALDSHGLRVDAKR